MALEDLLVHVNAYPQAPPDGALRGAVDLARSMGAKLTGLGLNIRVPLHTNRLAETVLHLSDAARAEEARSVFQTEVALTRLQAFAAAADIEFASRCANVDLHLIADAVTLAARTHDLCLVPIADGANGELAVAEAVIFGAGRPVLVYRAARPPTAALGLKRIVIAWDGGRAAARAVADALPLLTHAEAVHVLTIDHDKALPAGAAGHDLVLHLERHSVVARFEELEARNRPAGLAIDGYLARVDADLLVMGAYGHSRLRDFILGGVTEHALGTLVRPVLMSHA